MSLWTAAPDCMRYIGNKRKLLPFIQGALERLEIGPGTACDPFAGTASVARRLKTLGFDVVTGDIMTFSHVLQWAYVVVDEPPRFEGVRELVPLNGKPLASVLAALNALPGRPGFVHEHFSPGGAEGAKHERMYFTPENAARIDVIRHRIRDWASSGRLTDDERYVLLAALIEAADRVANTTGIYAACVKSWQPNARRRLRLRRPPLVVGTGRECRAVLGDATDLVAGLPTFDLLYLDPPYNTRQYPGYYHVPELLAEGWFDETPTLRGKTGLLDDAEKRSDWSRRRRCEAAFQALLDAADCRHILMSYNSEGIIPERRIEEAFRARGQPDTYRRLEVPYKRYRSDRDGANRRYSGDRVVERLYYVRVD